jgi:hypothetical protein
MAPSLFGDEEIENEDASSEWPTDDSTAEDEDAEYRKLLKACGGIDPENPNKLVLDQPMKAIPVRQAGTEAIVVPIRYTADFDGDLLIRSSINKNEINRSFSLIDIKPALAAKMARERLAAPGGWINYRLCSLSRPFLIRRFGSGLEWGHVYDSTGAANC